LLIPADGMMGNQSVLDSARALGVAQQSCRQIVAVEQLELERLAVSAFLVVLAHLAVAAFDAAGVVVADI